MISEFEIIRKIFLEIDSKLDSPVGAYLIGGAALMHYGSKTATKDIDLVFQKTEDFIKVRKTLIDLRFSSKTTPMTHGNFTLADWLTRDDFRLDLFDKVICGKLSVTSRIAGRSTILIKLEKLNIFVCSKEDIFLFKSITERLGDKEDCIELIKQGVNWDTVFDELNNQIKETGADIWITIVNERLEELSELGLTIPILKQVQALTEICYEKLARSAKNS